MKSSMVRKQTDIYLALVDILFKVSVNFCVIPKAVVSRHQSNLLLFCFGILKCDQPYNYVPKLLAFTACWTPPLHTSEEDFSDIDTGGFQVANDETHFLSD